MCGFAAALSISGAAIELPQLNGMAEAIAHRGPDGDGVYVTPIAGLAHRRLSIIDVDGGAQPWRHQNLTMIYNGEIYNYNELKRELESDGVSFSSSSDTEVIIKAYQHWGVSAFSRFDGMFAIVIFDENKKEFVVARDRFGIKPLYACDELNGIRLFASEIQGIKGYTPSFRWDLDVFAIDNFMRLGYYIEPRTAYKNIRQIKPGTIEIHKHKSSFYDAISFWSSDVALSKPYGRKIEDEEGIQLVERSVESQSVRDEDVKIGTFLSGGLDSTLITSILKSQNINFETFSAGFDIQIFNEIPLAEKVSSRLGVKNNSVLLSSDMLSKAHLIPSLYGAAFADNAAYPTYCVAKEAAKKGVKVVLSGDGADELFFGYKNHYAIYMENKIKRLIPGGSKGQAVMRALGKYYPNSPSMPRLLRAASTFSSLGMSLPESYCEAMSVASQETVNSLYSATMKLSLGGFDTSHDFIKIDSIFSHDDPMKRLQHLDFKTYLPGSVLTKLDRATMRAGVESRVPFLSNELADRVLSQPSSLNISTGRNKRQLRRWSKSFVHEDSRKRVKKSFTSPLDTWFSSLQDKDFYCIILLDKLVDSGMFEYSSLLKIREEHQKGLRNHGTLLWSLAVLSHSL